MRLRLASALAAAVLLSPALLSADVSTDESDAPVAPLKSQALEGWEDTYILKNGAMKVIVAPSVGRIVSIRLTRTDSFLNLNEGLRGKTADPGSDFAWDNFGGDWIWPTAQPRWKELTGRDWPPPSFIDDRPWTAHAWRTREGYQHCLMTKDYGEPLHITVSRSIRLDKTEQVMTIAQKIERNAASEVPVTLWHITQVDNPDHVFLSTDNDSAFENGYKVLGFSPPADGLIASCTDTIVYNTMDGEHKLGSDTSRGWIAAQKGEFVIVTRAEGGVGGMGYPDGGCRVEMYSNSGLGYSEIETLSEEVVLQPGEALENTLTISCHAVETNMPICELSEQVRRLIGEID